MDLVWRAHTGMAMVVRMIGGFTTFFIALIAFWVIVALATVLVPHHHSGGCRRGDS